MPQQEKHLLPKPSDLSLISLTRVRRDMDPSQHTLLSLSHNKYTFQMTVRSSGESVRSRAAWSRKVPGQPERPVPTLGRGSRSPEAARCGCWNRALLLYCSPTPTQRLLQNKQTNKQRHWCYATKRFFFP